MTNLDEEMNISANIEQIMTSGQKYFCTCEEYLEETLRSPFRPIVMAADYYWERLSSDLKKNAKTLIQETVLVGKLISMACKTSTLVNDLDVRELSRIVKSARAAINLRNYRYLEADVAHDEGQVLGFIHESQSEEEPLTPGAAKEVFQKALSSMQKLLELVDEESIASPTSSEYSLATPSAARFRRNTAFIMMWMDTKQPELDDIKDTVQETFGSFGIKAIRADDIEHEDVITKRIIDQITTSEFLFADLTGARPSVYYEVGYAHALGKRVILFRRKGTDLHFDLAGYNCPEYDNLRDLKGKLTKRLEQMTNRKPDTGETRPRR